MKKILAAVLSFALAFTCFAFVGCNKRPQIEGLKETVNEILAEMEESGDLDALINSYFDGTATFTYENPEYSDDCFVVATNAYFPPFEYYEGDKFAGIDIEIASIIAEKLDKTLYVKDMEFDSIINSVKTGESDIGMAGMTVNEDRLQHVDFSTGYYESAQVITVKADNTEFDGKTAEEIEAILSSKTADYKIGTQNGTTGYMYSYGDEGFGYDGFKNLTTQGYPTGALAMADLSNGKIDAVILDKQPSLMIAEGKSELKVISDVDLTAETYAFAIKKA